MYNLNYKIGDIKMCSVGGPPDFDFEMGQVEKYKCKDCGGEFKGIGKNPSCPKCASEKVEPVK
jgi:Zn finger protein HypA/HybF involved in hydrogenase expression